MMLALLMLMSAFSISAPSDASKTRSLQSSYAPRHHPSAFIAKHVSCVAAVRYLRIAQDGREREHAQH